MRHNPLCVIIPQSSIRLTMPVAFIYQIPPVDANVAQIVSACQRPAMQIFPVSCFWQAAPRKNAHAAWTRTNSLIWPLITSSFSCTIFSDIVCCLLSEWCVVTSFYQRAANHVFFCPLFNLRNLFYLISDLGCTTTLTLWFPVTQQKDVPETLKVTGISVYPE